MENTSTIQYTVYIEATPNPASMKFVANKLLINEKGATAEYSNINETTTAPIAKRLFELGFVKNIFIASNYITVTKTDEADWNDITLELRVFITEYLNAGNLIITALPEQQVPIDNSFTETKVINTQHQAPQSEIEAKIIELLDKHVRPAVSNDGGLITFKDYKDGIVTVQMRGACSGCPSGKTTLKQGVEKILKQHLPDAIKEVVNEAI